MAAHQTLVKLSFNGKFEAPWDAPSGDEEVQPRAGRRDMLKEEDLKSMAALVEKLSHFEPVPSSLRCVTPYFGYSQPPDSTSEVYVGGLVSGMDEKTLEVHPLLF